MSAFKKYASCLKNSGFLFPRLENQERWNTKWMLLKAAVIPDFHPTVRSYGVEIRSYESINSSSGQNQDLTPLINGEELVSLKEPKPASRRGPGRPSGAKNKPKPKKPKSGSRAGRPPGSRNKPKLPDFTARESHSIFLSHVLEVSDGSDIHESVKKYASERQRGVYILNGTGTVTNITLKQSDSANGIVGLQGRFKILSLSGPILTPLAPPAASGLQICLASGHGQVMGGTVVGPLVAAGPVVLMTTSFEHSAYQTLPLEDKESTLVVKDDSSSENDEASENDEE